MWLAHETGAGVGPGAQNVKLQPTTTITLPTPDGVHAIRLWPKMGCNDLGNDCSLGSSGGPGQGCVHKNSDGSSDYSRCGPPIDTKFEASWGRSGKPCNSTSQDGCDFVDMSLVDGYTLPFTLDIQGKCSKPQGVLDCSGLSLDRCPAGEQMAGSSHSLHAKNPATGAIAGCYSPCSKLIFSHWGNKAVGRSQSPAAAPYCCPTPPMSPKACREGPIERTRFVSLIRKHCKGAYAYSYDDEMGLSQCEPTTHYKLTFFCPSTPQPRLDHKPPVLLPVPAVVPVASIVETPIPWGGASEESDANLAAAAMGGERGDSPALCDYPNLKLCGLFIPGRSCQCDAFCKQMTNCCPDYSGKCNTEDIMGNAGGRLTFRQPQARFEGDERVRMGAVACVVAMVTSVLWATFHLLMTRRYMRAMREDAQAASEARLQFPESLTCAYESVSEEDEPSFEANQGTVRYSA